MVIKLVGNVNGEAVIFQRVAEDFWEITVPASQDGTYVINMTAEDEAGNEAYWAKYILTFDIASLCARLTRHPYQADILQNKYTASICSEKYSASTGDDWKAEVEKKAYYAKVKKGRCCNHAC